MSRWKSSWFWVILRGFHEGFEDKIIKLLTNIKQRARRASVVMARGRVRESRWKIEVTRTMWCMR